jgi:hypothetical protein
MVEQTTELQPGTELEPGEAWNRAIRAVMSAGQYGGQGMRTAAGRATRRAGATSRRAGKQLTTAGGRAYKQAELAASEAVLRLAAAYDALRGHEARREWHAGDLATIAAVATGAGALTTMLVLYSRWRRPIRPAEARIHLGARSHGRHGQRWRVTDADGPALGDQPQPPRLATAGPNGY